MDTQSHAHLKQLLVDRLPDCALVVLDIDGKVLSWNDGARGLLGYEEADAVGLPFSRIVPPETLDPAGAPPSLEIARRNGRHEEICERMHSNGTELALREVVIPLHDSKQNLVAFGLMMQSLEAARAAAAPPAVFERRKAGKILLVDDDDTVRVTAKLQLEDLGFEVVAAASGDEALDLLSCDRTIDVLFTDVIMPGMDGGELAEQARLIQRDLRIVFTSGYLGDALVNKGNITSTSHLLAKPYRRRDLASMMRRILAEEVHGSHHRPTSGP
ncbi:response regulator [Reyranella sp.]|uniref:response regulator n=1 Tax=Reyranella sp. TaxID=1929291 RepID=UPI003BAA566A